MTGISHSASVEIARRFPSGERKTFADIGTAQGDLAVQIALAQPHLRGCGFDLAELGPMFEEYVSHHGFAERLTFVPGDFFAGPMPRRTCC
jgi:O-methyltransferase domain